MTKFVLLSIQCGVIVMSGEMLHQITNHEEIILNLQFNFNYFILGYILLLFWGVVKKIGLLSIILCTLII